MSKIENPVVLIHKCDNTTPTRWPSPTAARITMTPF